jgi:hypothetical protein
VVREEAWAGEEPGHKNIMVLVLRLFC